MTKTVEIILFCIAFLTQVLLISWFYVRRVVRERRYVLRNFPPATHPKLYSQPVEYYESRLGTSSA
jgi:phospholipid N-methyltransferase